jgi:hypothetical protein
MSYYRGIPYHSCCSCGQYAQPAPVPWWLYCQGWQQPWSWHEPEHFHGGGHIAKELTADSSTTSATAVAGGAEPAHLFLEYEADSGASSPSVTVTITDSSETAVWTLTGFPSGFHVKRGFARVQPGAQLKLQVASTTAHLRWFEFVS